MKRGVLGFVFGCVISTPLLAIDMGAYLAGRYSLSQRDYGLSAGYLARALVSDPQSIPLQMITLNAHLSSGAMDQAIQISDWADVSGVKAPLVDFLQFAKSFETENYQAVLDRLGNKNAFSGGLNDLIKGWAHMGMGDVPQALQSFEKVSEMQGLYDFAMTHKAFALAMNGDFEQARLIFEGSEDTPSIMMTQRSFYAYLQILAQTGRRERAISLLRKKFTGTTNLTALAMLEKLESGADFDFITSPKDGVAEVFFTLAQVFNEDATPETLLLYTRLSYFLAPDHMDALLLSASLLHDMDKFDLALDTYGQIPENHPAHLNAQIGRASILQDLENNKDAIDLFKQLTHRYPDIAFVQDLYADALRQDEQYVRAQSVYDRIIANIDVPESRHWFVYFARAVTLERQDKWDDAEKDFRQSIALGPEQATVLNYFGYSCVDRGLHLDEGLRMIQRADAADPNQGHIIDSLGWAHYKLGNYDLAVQHLERALQAIPMDPILNDHFGDALWHVGRKYEARFQWSRALSFDPLPEDAARISRKLAEGLDIVLHDEKANNGGL